MSSNEFSWIPLDLINSEKRIYLKPYISNVKDYSGGLERVAADLMDLHTNVSTEDADSQMMRLLVHRDQNGRLHVLEHGGPTATDSRPARNTDYVSGSELWNPINVPAPSVDVKLRFGLVRRNGVDESVTFPTPC